MGGGSSDPKEELLMQPKESLQDAFMKFKKERQLQRKLTKKNKELSRPTTVAEKEALRNRFVEVCKGYLGVPYHRKYHQDPSDPDHDAPLFLDCCGLVRRAMLDLKEEFGFIIGTWNQAYQFETLPTELTFEQLKPGDLVFCEGVYYDQKLKPQKHNMVHVEVFTGGESGEETIGSRYAKSIPEEGKVRGVQMHKSYRYTSRKYEVIRFHFRSLETWLNGVCKSNTYPDAVTQAVINCGGKSIFERDQDAEDAETEEEVFVPNPHGPSPVFYVGEGNNWQAVASVLEERGWRRLPFDAGFSTRYDLKWVESKCKIDYLSHVEGQLTNHIPNNDVITSKVQFLETVRQYEAASGTPFTWHPESYCSSRPGEKLAAIAAAEASPDAVWILKPSRGNGGKGIQIVRGAAVLKQWLFPEAVQHTKAETNEDNAQADATDTSTTLPDAADAHQHRALAGGEGWVVQRYLERPLLLKGRKFDLRAYCLIARTNPHIWLFHPGYCKVSLENYSEDIHDRFAHITNACQQKTHPKYKESRGQHIWSLHQAEEALIEEGQRSEPVGTFWPPLHQEMKRCLAWLYEASRGKLERRAGYFDLLGVDFMLDDSCGLHLLEVNSNPAIWFDSSAVLKELVPRLLAHSMDTVLAAQAPNQSTLGAGVPLLGDFELIADEAQNFVFGKEA